MRSPILTRPAHPEPVEASNLRRLQADWDEESTIARVRAIIRAARHQGEPPFWAGALLVGGVFALLPLIAAVLP